MQLQPAKRKSQSYPKRSVESIHTNYNNFMAAGGDRETVKNCYNCVAEGTFPISQVHLYSQLSNNKFTFTVGMPTWATHYCRHPHKDIWAARGCLPQFSLQLALTSHQQKACSISSFTHYLNELKKLQVAQAKQVQFQSAVCFRETGSLIPA